MAQKKAAGSTRNGRDSRGRRLGIKISGNALAKPGAIIVKQRGTKFFPGTGTTMGKDHSIMSICDGHVTFKKRHQRLYVQVS